MTTTMCVLPTFPLAGFLTDLLRTASGDDTFPVLHGIALHSVPAGETGHLLVGTSTDRYTAGQATEPCVGGLPRPVLLPTPSVRQILAVLAPYTTHAAGPRQSTLGVDDRGVTVTVEPVRDGSAGTVAVTVPELPGGMDNFPNVGKILTDAAQAPTAAEPVTLNPGYVGRFTDIGLNRSQPVHLDVKGPSSAVMVRIGEHYTGIVMPQRHDNELPAVVVHHPAPATKATAYASDAVA